MQSLILAFLLAVSPARAQEEDATAALSGNYAQVAEHLGLDVTQRKQVADAVFASNTAKIDIKARAEKARLELKHLLAADGVDEKAVMKAVDALSASEAELRRNRVQLLLNLRKVLKPDQWRKLLEMREERRDERREERREDRRERREERFGEGEPGR